MIDEEDRYTEPGWLRRHMTVLIGIAGLIAWFALVWLMFGDVL